MLNYYLPDKLREVVRKFKEQNAFDEMILAPKRKKKKCFDPFLLVCSSQWQIFFAFLHLKYQTNILNKSNCWYIPSLIEANRSFNLWSTLGPKAKLLTNTTLQWLKYINKQWVRHFISVQNIHYFNNSHRSSRCCKNVEVCCFPL